MSPAPLTALPTLNPETASPEAGAILKAAQESMGMIPTMYGNMAQLPGLLAAYVEGYQRFRKESQFDAAEQEVVLLAISRENECEYCVAAHSTLAAGPSKVPAAVIRAIRDATPIDDPRLGALARMTQVMVRTRGRPSPADLEAFQEAGYTDRHVLALILAISVKTISNYTNHFFDTPVDQPFQAFAWERPVATTA